MLAELKQKSQLTIPKEFIEKLDIKIGETLQIDLSDNQIIITPIAIVPKDQIWFYTKKWQKMEKEVDEQIKNGKTFSANSPKDLFKKLGI